MRFVDANALICSFDLEPSQPEETAIAQKILAGADIALSVQVLQEFYVQATHVRRPDALSHNLAARFIEKWQRFRIQDNTVTILQSALRLKERFQISYWDAAILAAAKAARCQQLLSEDLNHGQDYDGVVVVNPFISHPKSK
jgi:predicted nucleic acid-binding protein